MVLKTWDNYPQFYKEDYGPHSRPMSVYLLAKLQYYKGKPIMTDVVFDEFEAAIRERYPDCPALQVVGEPCQEDFKELTVWCVETRLKEAHETN